MGLAEWLPDWQVFTPEIVILLFAVLAPIVGTWDSSRRGMQQFALTGLIGAFLLTLGSLLRLRVQDLFGIGGLDFDLDYISTSAAAGFPTANAFMVTEASQVFKLVFLGVAILAVLGVGRPLAGKAAEDYAELFSLILFATLGMMVVASAQDLIVLFLGVETASLASYLLAGFKRDKDGAEAALKYFVIGAIASGLSLFAISLLYGAAGSTHLPTIAQNITSGGPYVGVGALAAVMLLVGLGFKISSVPTHAWAPDVYCGAPAPVVAMLASASKAMGFLAIFNVFLVALIGISTKWELAVALVAATTMFVGNLVALQQTSIRRMLAYSSIAQAGYVLIAVAVVGSVGNEPIGAAHPARDALAGGVFHLIVNAAMKLGAFLVVAALLVLGIPDHQDGWKGLARRAPVAALAMTVFLLSMAGIPPLGGFMSKFLLFGGAVRAGIHTENAWLIWLAAVAIINSAVSLYYYLRVIRVMYVEEGERSPLRLGRGAMTAVLVCFAAIIIMGIAPGWFVDVSTRAAASILGT